MDKSVYMYVRCGGIIYHCGCTAYVLTCWPQKMPNEKNNNFKNRTFVQRMYRFNKLKKSYETFDNAVVFHWDKTGTYWAHIWPEQTARCTWHVTWQNVQQITCRVKTTITTAMKTKPIWQDSVGSGENWQLLIACNYFYRAGARYVFIASKNKTFLFHWIIQNWSLVSRISTVWHNSTSI